MIIFSALVAFAIAVWSALAIWATLARRTATPVPPPPPSFPTISIIVAALNEERHIARAMESLLELDYPDFEIIVVDDRSTDATGAILDRLAEAHPGRIRVAHVESLPAGWLGKCHALHVGSQHATGEWILFTDADVVFERESLRAAVCHAYARAADHIVFAPRLVWHGYAEAALLTLFSIGLTIAFRMWLVESRSLRAFVGFGSFNLVRRSVYERFGGHRTLRLEVADDMKLGYLVKKHGGRSMYVDSEGMVNVRWREGARDVVRGIERSGFAGVDFNWVTIIAATMFFTVVMLAPYVIIVTGPDVARVIAGAALALLVVAHGIFATGAGMPAWIGVLNPIACVMFAWAFLRSAVVSTRAGGLYWRGTFYSIDELRDGTVR